MWNNFVLFYYTEIKFFIQLDVLVAERVIERIK